jgi:cell division protein FtsW
VKNRGIDLGLLGVILALLGLGVVMVYSASTGEASRLGVSSTYFLVQHLKKMVIGMAAFLVGMAISPEGWRKAARPFFFFSVFLMLLMLLTPLGIAENGATRWMSLKGFRFQPSELMRIGFVLFLALKLEEVGEELQDYRRSLLPALALTGVAAGLVLAQPNMSMALIIVATALGMLHGAGLRMKQLFATGAAVIPLAGVGIILEPYRMKRVLSFLSPDETSPAAHQSLHAMLGLGHGGLWGTGLGRSTEKLGYLPMANTDTIFAILGEELGFLGTAAVLILFGILLYKGIAIAMSRTDLFQSLVALGITLGVAANLFIHIGVCTRFGPTTGQPLPLVSYGGTNLILTLLALGILVGLSGRPGHPVRVQP